MGYVMTLTVSKKQMIESVLEGFFATWALMKAGRMEPGNVLTAVFFFFATFAFYQIKKNILNRMDKRRKVTAVVLAAVFTMLYILVDYKNYIEELTNRLFQVIIVGAVFLGFIFLFYHLIVYLFSYFCYDEKMKSLFCQDTAQGFFRKHIFAISFLVCMICWLPYFLYEFPGIMTPDSVNQYEQVMGVISYSNHHPWVHTMLIKLLYSFGSIFTDNPTIAASFYTFFQMLVMALIAAYLLSTMVLYRVKNIACIIVLAFYALVPFNAVFAVTVWKDILFAGAVLLFSITVFRMVVDSNMSGKTKGVQYGLFLLSGLMICLFRSVPTF